jgi:ATP-binding cassette subfamily F protein 3
MTLPEIRNTLAAFMFTGDDVFKPMGALSGGERGRVALCKIMLGQSNFLILDEPTNHLDIDSKEILEEVLRQYTGTLLYVSHDRYFINNTAEKIFELTSAGLGIYLGNYDAYLEKVRTPLPEAQKPPRGSDWRHRKVSAANERKAAARLQRLEAEIHSQETVLKDIDAQMDQAPADLAALQTLAQARAQGEARLEILYGEWEGLQGDAEG